LQDPSKLLKPHALWLRGTITHRATPDLSYCASRCTPQSRQPPPSALAIPVPLATLCA